MSVSGSSASTSAVRCFGWKCLKMTGTVQENRGAGRSSPVLPRTEGGPVSAATLLLKAKQFDDGLYAAVELAAQQGAGRFPGNAVLLSSLAATLAAGLPGKGTGAATAIHAACALGGIPVTVPEALVEPVRTARAGFTAKADFVSKPLGFYTWTDQLQAIFLQDRFLQQPLELDTAAELARAVKNTPGASVACDACLRLHNRLTNPPKKPNIRDAGKAMPFFPPSRSHEVALFERLYESSSIPDGFDLMGELIRCVRSGKISLMPTEQSGWYDHQTWSLEPLIVPDRRPETPASSRVNVIESTSRTCSVAPWRCVEKPTSSRPEGDVAGMAVAGSRRSGSTPA